jgi:hypothetical protein
LRHLIAFAVDQGECSVDPTAGIAEADRIDPVRSARFIDAFDEKATRIKCGAKCGAPGMRLESHSGINNLPR